MSRFNLRQRSTINYFEAEEPELDEYIYCDQCLDYVYEYCSIHGQLVVLPDDKVPAHTNLPSYVPRAALTIPSRYLHIAPSIIPGAGLGVFATKTLSKGIRFGPYVGLRENSNYSESMYCWQIYNNNRKAVHLVDGSDSSKSNWMRFVNCSRHWHEQNLSAYQFRGQIYYRTIKLIPRNTELLVYYGTDFAQLLHINFRLYNAPRLYLQSASNQETKQHNNKKIEDNNAFSQDIIDSERKTIEAKEKPHESDSLKNCITTDSNEKPYKCNLCSYKSEYSGNLKTHKRIHSGEKPYKCNICSYKSAKSGNLETHKRIHSGEKPYKCNICSYKSTQSGALETHKRIHSGEKPYKCNICSYKSARSSDLKRHTKGIHNKLPPMQEYVVIA